MQDEPIEIEVFSRVPRRAALGAALFYALFACRQRLWHDLPKYAILDALPSPDRHGKEVFANGEHCTAIHSLCRGGGSLPLPVQMA